MAIQETVILNFEVDQTDAQKNLVLTEKKIISLKKEQAELNKQYKAGEVAQDEYVESNLRLQQEIKKESDQKRNLTKLLSTESNSRNAVKARISELVKEYDNLNTRTETGAKRADELQKELTELNSQITKTSKSAGLFKDQIGNYPEAFSKAASEVEVAGVSIDGIGKKLSSFLNPVTAVVGVLGGLTSAYASSVAGARDLAKAQGLVSSATEIATESFGEFIAQLAGVEEGGPGIFEGLVFGLLNQLDTGLAVSSLIKANNKELIKDLEISRALSQAAAKEDERRAENARRIRDDENESLQERLEQTTKIDQVLSQSAQRSVIVIQAQINAIKNATTNYEKNREAQLQVAQLTAEISDKQEEINGKLTENVTARRNILKLIEEERKATSEDDRAQRRAISGPDAFTFAENDTSATAEEEAQAEKTEALIQGGEVQLDVQKAINDRLLAINKKFYSDDLKAKETFAALKQKVDEAQLQAAVTIAGAAASLFDQQSNEYKLFATAQTLISTYSTAQKAYEAAFTPPTVASPALAAAYVASAIATGLANVAQINGIGFAEGGYTGSGGKYEPAGIVHKEEYVVPQNVMSIPAARPHVSALESYRVRGFADGGFTTNQNTAPVQQAMITANALKNLPPTYVSWKEGQVVGRRVEWRESKSKI